MNTSLILTAVAFLAGFQGDGGQDQKLLELPDLGIALSHPKVWQVSQIKKSNDYKVLVPVEGSSQSAELELYGVAFDAEKDVWQLAQKGINDRMKREIMRQWEEEILGVPLLLTKVSYSDKSGPHILLTGLLYSRTPKKLMFRLTASPDDYDKAEFAWRQSMQTFRTGVAFRPEDGTQKPSSKKPGERQQVSLPPPIISKPKSLAEEGKITKPPVAIEATVAGRKVELRVPEGWVGKVDDQGAISLTHPDLAKPLIITLASSLDSDPPQRALFQISSKTLNDYDKVTKRDETVPTKNRAGAMVATVWRVGTNGAGELFTCDAVGSNGDFYFMLSYRTGDPAKIGSERKSVEALLQSMTLEQLP